MKVSRRGRSRRNRFKDLEIYTNLTTGSGGQKQDSALKQPSQQQKSTSGETAGEKPLAAQKITIPSQPKRSDTELRKPAGKPSRKAAGEGGGTPPTASTPAKKRSAFRFFRYAFFGILVVGVIAMGAALGQLRVYLNELPTEKALEEYRPRLISRMFSSDDRLIGEYVRVERRKYVSIKDVPQILIDAVIAREDKNFYKHFGLDIEGILRAIYVDIKTRSFKEGGSTLTQQLVKNLTSRREKAIKRKIKEALLALKVEQTYSKDEIMEMYLNQVYFGHGRYGVGSAAEFYFGKDVGDLELHECAMLAGLIQRPETHSPFNNAERARIRRISVLRNMHEQGFIGEQQMQEFAKRPLRLAVRKPGKQKNLAPHFYEYIRLSMDDSKGANGSIVSYPMETSVVQEVGHEKLYSDGLRIRTTLNFKIQEVAERAVRKGLHRVEQLRRKHPSDWGAPGEQQQGQRTLEQGGVYDALIVDRISENQVKVKLHRVPGQDGTWPVTIDLEESWLDDFGVLEEGYYLQVRADRSPSGSWYFEHVFESHAQSCLITLDVSTGSILAMVGGYDFFEDHPGAKIIFPFQAKLQPGSCFKPILYACALSKGMTMSDTVTELPLQYEFGDKVWRIENFESRPWNPSLHGETPLRRALIKSMNVASVHLWNRLTNDNNLATVSRFARRNMGIQSPVRNERASALGVSELYPVELAVAFASFANGGRRVRPYAIIEVTDHYGNLLARQYPDSIPVLSDPRRSAQVAYLITHMLQDVVRDPEGTAYRTLGELYPGEEGFPFPIGGKTGTTNDCTDAWFCGFSPNLVTCVWVGFERKKSLGESVTGSKAALPIWADFMEDAIPIYRESMIQQGKEGSVKEDFSVPAGIVFRKVCAKSGGLANRYCTRPVEGAFIEGTAPTSKCAYHGPAETEAFEQTVKEMLFSERISIVPQRRNRFSGS